MALLVLRCHLGYLSPFSLNIVVFMQQQIGVICWFSDHLTTNIASAFCAKKRPTHSQSYSMQVHGHIDPLVER